MTEKERVKDAETPSGPRFLLIYYVIYFFHHT